MNHLNIYALGGAAVCLHASPQVSNHRYDNDAPEQLSIHEYRSDTVSVAVFDGLDAPT